MKQITTYFKTPTPAASLPGKTQAPKQRGPKDAVKPSGTVASSQTGVFPPATMSGLERKNAITIPRPKAGLHALTHAHWAAAARAVDKERKTKSKPLTEEDEAELGAAMADAASVFVNPRITYKFRLATTYELNYDASGALLEYISWDATSFSEHTAYLKYMFQECRISHTTLTIVPRCGTPGADGSIPTLAISSTFRYVATAPTSVQGVIEEPNSCIRSGLAFGCAPATNYRWSVSVPKDYLWADVNAASPGLNQGTWGQWQIATATAGPVSSPACTVMLECIIEYRARD